MRSARVQEALVETTRVARRVVRTSVTTDVVVQAAELRMVENVESLGTEFEELVFRDKESLEQTHVEVQTVRVAQDIAACIAERQPRRCGKRTGVVEQRTLDVRSLGDRRRGVRVADNIGIRSLSRS